MRRPALSWLSLLSVLMLVLVMVRLQVLHPTAKSVALSTTDAGQTRAILVSAGLTDTPPAPSDTPTPLATPTATSPDTPTISQTPSATSPDTLTPQDTSMATSTDTPTPAPSETPTQSSTSTAISTDSPTPTPPNTATPTETPTTMPTATPIPTETPTTVPTATSLPTDSATSVATPTSTTQPTSFPPTPRDTGMNTALPPPLPAVNKVATPTATDLPTATDTSTETAVPPSPVTPGAAASPRPTSTSTPALAPTLTPLPSLPPTATSRPTVTAVPTRSKTPGIAPSVTPQTALITLVKRTITSDAAVMEAAVRLPNDTATSQNPKYQRVRLLVPAGSVHRPTVIGVALVPPGATFLHGAISDKGGHLGIGWAIILSARDATTGMPQPALLRPLTLQLGYDPTALGNLSPTGLHIAYLAPDLTRWTPLETTVDRDSHVLTTRLSRSFFTPLQVGATAGTKAQITSAQARLTTHPGATSVEVKALPSTSNAPSIDGVPVLVSLSPARTQAPVLAFVTSKPGASLVATLAVSGFITLRRQAILDPRGYAVVRFTPIRPLTQTHRARLAITIKGNTTSQAFSSGLTLTPGQRPRDRAPVDLLVAPSLGLPLFLTFGPHPVRLDQTASVTITTAGGAGVHLEVYAGSHRVATGAGHATKSGIFHYALRLTPHLLRNVALQQGARTLIVTARAQVGGHLASTTAPLEVRS